MNRHLKHDILRLLALTVGLLLMVILLSGCRPTQIITDNNSETHDTIIQIRHSRDSIFVRDSILVKTANDTVFVDRWHERCRYLIKRDTIYQTRDSVHYEVITKTVTEYKTPWWCRVGLLLLLLGLVAFLLLLVVKKWTKNAQKCAQIYSTIWLSIRYVLSYTLLNYLTIRTLRHFCVFCVGWYCKKRKNHRHLLDAVVFGKYNNGKIEFARSEWLALLPQNGEPNE